MEGESESLRWGGLDGEGEAGPPGMPGPARPWVELWATVSKVRRDWMMHPSPDTVIPTAAVAADCHALPACLVPCRELYTRCPIKCISCRASER